MSKLFGTTKKGEEVHVYTLENSKGMKAEILDFGAIVKNLYVPDGRGGLRDVVLGFDDLKSYEENPSFFGAVIAPSANRIGKATFTIDETEYHVDKNSGPDNLHSHYDLATHKRVWKAEEKDNSLTLSIELADMDMGFPGNKVFTVTYVLTEENALELHYTAKSDKNTIINPTNHSYFNLSGHKSGKILDHELKLNASRYSVIVEGAIPTGELRAVEGSIMDFTKGRVVGKNINDDFEQLLLTQGYDHNFVLDDYDGTVKEAAVVTDKASGGVMTVYTDLPGIQFYAGNCIAHQDGKEGAKYGVRDALCLETQFFPDSVNHPNFPSCIFGPGKDYKSTTIYAFKY